MLPNAGNMFCVLLNRKLTTGQRNFILKACEAPTPLYLKLACSAARRWKSYTPESEIKLAPTPREIIKQFFDRYRYLNSQIKY